MQDKNENFSRNLGQVWNRVNTVSHIVKDRKEEEKKNTVFRVENEEMCLRKSRNDSVAGLVAPDEKRSSAPCCPCCYFYPRCCQWVHFLSQSRTPCGHSLPRLMLHWSWRQQLLHFQQIKKNILPSFLYFALYLQFLFNHMSCSLLLSPSPSISLSISYPLHPKLQSVTVLGVSWDFLFK